MAWNRSSILADRGRQGADNRNACYMSSDQSGRSAQSPTFDANCRRCRRLTKHLSALRTQYPTYHNAPVPAFGPAGAGLLIVGLAPGMHGANATGRPFTGDHAGILLYETLYRAGLSTARQSVTADDSLTLDGCRITNAVKCLPPGNKPTTSEIDECNGYLRAELLKRPRPRVIMCLGGIAHRAVLKALRLKASEYRFAHGAEHDLPDGISLIDSYHCSRYNTQTGRLTNQMFHTAVMMAKARLTESK